MRSIHKPTKFTNTALVMLDLFSENSYIVCKHTKKTHLNNLNYKSS